MIQLSQASGAEVLLTGIMLPPNYGESYTERFHALYGELAESYDALLVPFFMDGVALVDGMMQDDGIHPSVAGAAGPARKRLDRARARTSHPRQSRACTVIRL